MIVGIFANTYRDIDLSITKEIMRLLQDSRIDFLLFEDIAKKLNKTNSFNFSSKEKIDVLITVGGDGTILRTAVFCAKNNISILGINLGKVGFLTEFEKDNLDKAINLLASNNFNIEKRMMLEVNYKNSIHYALNEAVIDRSAYTKMILLDVEINEQFVDSYFCDGFIVSTPTGSTAYSLSAGGSVISPNTNAIALTPVNSHSLHSRPIVVNDTEIITILGKERCNANVVVDGVTLLPFGGNDKVIISKSKISVNFIRLKDSNFYSKLLTKLNNWSITKK